MSTVLYAKPAVRLDGKKARWGYLIVTDKEVLHVSPNLIYLKILVVGFVPFLLFGPMIAARHAAEWLANPPENSRVVPLGAGTTVRPGRFRMNSKALAVVTPDGQEHVFGVPYKKVQQILSPALAGSPVTVVPA